MNNKEEYFRDLYRSALTANEVRHWYRANTHVTTGGTVKEKVDALLDQMSKLQGIWGRCPQNENDKIDYERELNSHQKAIDHLKQIAEMAMIRDAQNGDLIGLGYSGQDALIPLRIPSPHWAYLKLDFIEGRAKGLTYEYAGVRFIGELDDDMNEHPDVSDQLQLTRLIIIIETASSLDFDLKQLEWGDKKKIENKCGLPAAAFKKAWQYGRDNGVIK